MKYSTALSDVDNHLVVVDSNNLSWQVLNALFITEPPATARGIAKLSEPFGFETSSCFSSDWHAALAEQCNTPTFAQLLQGQLAWNASRYG